jgi:hypothetical protein
VSSAAVEAGEDLDGRPTQLEGGQAEQAHLCGRIFQHLQLEGALGRCFAGEMVHASPVPLPRLYEHAATEEGEGELRDDSPHCSQCSVG